MASSAVKLPPLPPGFVLEEQTQAIPPLPPGFILERRKAQPEQPGMLRRAVGAAGQRILDLPENIYEMGKEALAPPRTTEEEKYAMVGTQGMLAAKRFALDPARQLWEQAKQRQPHLI